MKKNKENNKTEKNELQIIEQRELLGKEFRIYGSIDNPLFLAKDVAEWIEHSRASEMLKGIDDDEKLLQTTFHAGQNRKMWFLTLAGVKQILCNSRKSIAKEFLAHMDKGFYLKYKNQPKQTKFSKMLRDAIKIHINSDLDFKYCPI